MMLATLTLVVLLAGTAEPPSWQDEAIAARLALGKGESKEANRLAAQAVCLARQGELSGRDEARLLDLLGDTFSARGCNRCAERSYLSALDLRIDHFGTESLEVAASMDRLWRVYSALREDELSRAAVFEGLRLREKLLGADHPGVAESLGRVAIAIENEERWEESEALRRRALEIRVAACGRFSPGAWGPLARLISFLRDRGRRDEVEELQPWFWQIESPGDWAGPCGEPATEVHWWENY